MKKSLTYKDAGVNIDTTNRLIERIKSIAKTSFRSEVLTDIGGFSGLFSLNTEKYKKPILTASTDGVGTKLKIAFMTNIHDTVGIDLVAMCVNDILAQGAEPLFLLDYLSTSKVESKTVEAVISGISRGCQEAGCALIGGEIAEMPSFYKEGEYDLAGFVVGVVDQDKIIDGSEIKIGDKVVGIASSGLHSNGYSLVRKIVFEQLHLDPNKKMEEIGRKLGEELLEPTKIYVKPILNITSEIHLHGISHITGGGLVENIPRILPNGCQAVIHKGSWEIPPIFTFIQNKGNISEAEMLRTFNNGIGMALIISDEEAEDIISRLQNIQMQSYIIGEVVKRKEGEEGIIFT
ncbi:MAG: phosphoribosylaminoimidazole synthetase [Deltaproteobacteria bacterium DG_8]|nr:MAG: phosphoribosylaminoimidazole synthetase [Deltaproteobacteria bacterium DG_8]